MDFWTYTTEMGINEDNENNDTPDCFDLVTKHWTAFHWKHEQFETYSN